jgi:large subunit ribosomal protein L22
MNIHSLSRYVRMSPMKLRPLIRGLSGMPAERAIRMLELVPRRSARLLLKTLKSAVANAENNYNLSIDRLTLTRAVVNEGPRLKRFMPVARGSAHHILKRTSHVEVILNADEPVQKGSSLG